MTSREDRDDKQEMVRRHLRGAARLERRKRNEARGTRHREGVRPRAEDDPRVDEEDEARRPRRPKAKKGRKRRRAAAAPPSATSSEETDVGLVVGVHRGRLDVACRGRLFSLRLSGKRLAEAPATGDELVLVFPRREEHDAETLPHPRIDGLRPRRSLLVRPAPGNAHREKPIAANVDVGLIVVAAVDPPLRPALVDRYVIALERGGVRPVLCVSKVDLLGSDDARARLESVLAPYVELGLEVHRLSSRSGTGVDALRSSLGTGVAVLVGHSGVGKSTLLNALGRRQVAAEGEVRDHDGRGRHTTTSSALHELESGLRVIDTPGVREFGLWRIGPDELPGIFPGFSELPACRFADCRHVDEPGCAVREAVEADRFPGARYGVYLRLLASLEDEA